MPQIKVYDRRMKRSCLVISVLFTTICLISLFLTYIDAAKYFRAKPYQIIKSKTQKTDTPMESKKELQTIVQPHGIGLVKDIRENGPRLLKQKQRRYPTCLIIGAKKAGTGALVEYLNIHPKLSVRYEEPHFFERNSNYKRGLEYYRQQMPYTYPDQITIEKTPKYFISEMATRRIHEFNPNMKLILTLRHPVKRLVSDFEHNKRRGYSRPNATLTDLALDRKTGEVNTNYQPVYVSMYYVHLKRWLKYFPRNQIHVVDGDNLIVNPVQELEKIENFLGIEHFITNRRVYFNETKGFYCLVTDTGRRCVGKNKGQKHSHLDPYVYRKLMYFFEYYNKQLFVLLNRTFIWE